MRHTGWLRWQNRADLQGVPGRLLDAGRKLLGELKTRKDGIGLDVSTLSRRVTLADGSVVEAAWHGDQPLLRIYDSAGGDAKLACTLELETGLLDLGADQDVDPGDPYSGYPAKIPNFDLGSEEEPVILTLHRGDTSLCSGMGGGLQGRISIGTRRSDGAVGVAGQCRFDADSAASAASRVGSGDVFHVFENTTYTSSAENRRQCQWMLPSSHWTGLMRRYVQAIYGAPSAFYGLQTTQSGNSYTTPTLTLPLEGGTTAQAGFRFGNTWGLIDRGDARDYWFVEIAEATINFRRAAFTPCGEKALEYLKRVGESLTPENFRRIEAIVLSTCKPSAEIAQSVNFDDVAGLDYNSSHKPLAYGWKFNARGNKASIVLLTDDDYTSRTITIALTPTEGDAEFPFTVSASATAPKPYFRFVATAEQLMIFHHERNGGIHALRCLPNNDSRWVNITPRTTDPSTFDGPLYCWYDDEDKLRVVTYYFSWTTSAPYQTSENCAGITYDVGPAGNLKNNALVFSELNPPRAICVRGSRHSKHPTTQGIEITADGEMVWNNHAVITHYSGGDPGSLNANRMGTLMTNGAMAWGAPYGSTQNYFAQVAFGYERVEVGNYYDGNNIVPAKGFRAYDSPTQPWVETWVGSGDWVEAREGWTTPNACGAMFSTGSPGNVTLASYTAMVIPTRQDACPPDYVDANGWNTYSIFTEANSALGKCGFTAIRKCHGHTGTSHYDATGARAVTSLMVPFGDACGVYVGSTDIREHSASQISKRTKTTGGGAAAVDPSLWPAGGVCHAYYESATFGCDNSTHVSDVYCARNIPGDFGIEFLRDISIGTVSNTVTFSGTTLISHSPYFFNDSFAMESFGADGGNNSEWAVGRLHVVQRSAVRDIGIEFQHRKFSSWGVGPAIAASCNPDINFNAHVAADNTTSSTVYDPTGSNNETADVFDGSTFPCYLFAPFAQYRMVSSDAGACIYHNTMLDQRMPIAMSNLAITHNYPKVNSPSFVGWA